MNKFISDKQMLASFPAPSYVRKDEVIASVRKKFGFLLNGLNSLNARQEKLAEELARRGAKGFVLAVPVGPFHGMQLSIHLDRLGQLHVTDTAMCMT